MSELGRFRGRIAILAGVVVVVLAAGSAIALTRASATATPPGAAGVPHAKVVAKGPDPLTVVSTLPAQHAQHVNGVARVQVQFSAPLAPGSPLPSITPDVAGHWHAAAGTSTIQFIPNTGFPANAYVQVHIPGGASGVRDTDGGLLADSQIMYFHTGQYSATRLPQLLAELGYLPVTFAPAAGQTVPPLGDAAGQLAAAYAPPPGTFTFQPGYPAALHSFWDGGSPAGLMVRGAVIAFEADHSLAKDGIAGPAVWKALLAAADASQTNKHGYSYAIADQHSPETLTVWHDGKVVLHTAANTGIPAAPTTVGTDPVYLRYAHQIMRGTNPDGSKYADPVAWVAYFRAGEAVHYFPRASYGSLQSLGCVELPWKQAKYIWPYLTYGTLVTVTAQ